MKCSTLQASRRAQVAKAAEIFGAVICTCLLPITLFSQVNQARLLGSVTDQSGGVIAGASVTITDVQKNVSRTLTTDSAGEYVAPNLDPDTYAIRVEFRGFKTFTRQGMQLGVGQEARVDVTLQPGEQTQTVTVTEALPLIETTTATLTGTISNQTLNDLPLNGRNYVNLLTLRPGYVNLPGGGGGNQAGMGLRPGDNFFLLDGLNIYEWTQGQQIVNGYGPAGDAQTLLPIDAIQEFNIQQNPKAEFGWKPGVQVNLGLKSGTNNIHGTAYAFGRDGSWDAKNFFQPPTEPKPPLSFEQYGATAGGPIKKDKLFWFLGFESQRLDAGLTTAILAPADISVGDPSLSMVDACKALGPAKISPVSARLAGLNPTTCTVSPATSSFENVFPTNPGNQFAGSASQVVPADLFTLSDVNSTYNGLAKIDYHINDKNTLSGMFFIGQAAGTWDDNPSVIVSDWWESYLPVRNRLGSGSWTWTPSSAWVNEFKVGYTRQYSPFLSNDHTANPDGPWGLSNGIPTGYAINTGVTNSTYFGFPRINISGFTQLGGNWPKFVGPNHNLEFLDHISYLRGKNAFKFGGEISYIESSAGATSNAKGLVKFKNSKNGPPALENFLIGKAASGSNIFVGDPVRDVHTDHYGFFIEDDYRMTPRLTVNLGLRYELATVLKEKNNEIGVFDPNSPQGFVQVGKGISSPFNGDHNNFSPRAGVAWDINGKTVVRAGASMLYEYVPFSAFMNSGGNSVGLGKVPTGAELCVNGTCTQGNGNIAAATFNPDPSTLSSNWKSNGATPIFPTGAVACGDGNAIVSGPASLIGLSPVPCTTASFAQNLRTPYIITWNFDIQRAITNNLSLDLAYLGNHGVKLYGTRDINTPPLSAGYSPAGLAGCAADPTTCGNLPDLPELGPYSAKFPYIQYILELSNMYRSHYNAVQATLTERTSHGLSFTAAYTYSHALDDVSQNFGSTTPLDNANPGLNYGNSDYDIRHRFTLEATYALPGMKSPGQMLEGWQLNSIVTLQTGQPWAVQDTANDFSGTGEVNNPNSWGEAWNFYGNPKDFTSSPNGIPFFSGTSSPQCLAQATKDGALALASLTNNGCFANGSSILIPPAYGTFGTIGKNIFRDTPFRNWDLSVTKSWKFKERLTAQFRAEFFNVLNHPLFADVGSGHLANNDPSTGLLGLANETPDQGSGNAVLGSGAQREIQLGLKLIF
jgi:Carboxypeptidase regulatory-like domain/TonB dependent receptor